MKTLECAYLVLTNRCNSKCKSCGYWRQHQLAMLSYRNIIAVLQRLKAYRTRSVVLTGGEPTLHPSFEGIVRTAKELGIMVILSTNGLIASDRISFISGYMDSICVSLNGANPRQYKLIHGVDGYERALAFVHAVRKASKSIQIWISCMIQKQNYDSLHQIYKIARQSGSDGLYFLVPQIKDACFGWKKEFTANEQRKTILLGPDEIDEARKNLETIEKLESKNRRRFLCQSRQTLQFFIRYFLGFQGLAKLRPRRCLLPYNSVTITEEGILKPCLYLPVEIRTSLTKDFLACRELRAFKNKFLRRRFYRDTICRWCGQFKN